MKRLFISALTACTLLFASSCQDWLDVNHDPNVLGEIPSGKVLLPAAQVGIGNNLMGWDMGFAGGFWSEYWTQKHTASQFKFLCEYNETSFQTAYRSLTSGVLKDLYKIKNDAQKAGDNGLFFIAEALSIFTWQTITDVWGDIPYFEALKGEEGIGAPKFDIGEDIYADLNKRIDELLKVDLNKATVDSKYDFIYGGDMEQWMKFANSLKLKLMLRVSETSGYNNATVLNFVKSANLLTSSAKISGKNWSDGEEGKRHPMREFQEGGANYLSTNVIACKNFVDYLANNSDPRVANLFTMSDKKTGAYRGAIFGDFDSKEASDGSKADKDVTYSQVTFASDMDLMLMSTWEVNFYVAEVYARAADYATAKTFYEAGVRASLAQHGISDEAILSGYAQWTANTQDAAIEQIAMQRWVANANYQHIESFLERNRTKYPALYPLDIVLNRKAAFADPKVIGHLTIAVNGRAKLNASLPVAPIYPDEVVNRNLNSPEQKPNLGVKVWWNTKAEVVVQ